MSLINLQTICIQTKLAGIVLFIPGALFANHSFEHTAYDHDSNIVSMPVPIGAGVQLDREKAVETAVFYS